MPKEELKLSQFDLKQLQMWYDMKLSDKKISYHSHLSVDVVRRWRYLNGLHPWPEGERAMGPEEQLVIDAVAARKQGMSYGQYMAQKPLFQRKE